MIKLYDVRFSDYRATKDPLVLYPDIIPGVLEIYNLRFSYCYVITYE